MVQLTGILEKDSASLLEAYQTPSEINHTVLQVAFLHENRGKTILSGSPFMVPPRAAASVWPKLAQTGVDLVTIMPGAVGSEDALFSVKRCPAALAPR